MTGLLAVLEKQLRQTTYLVGEQLSLADVIVTSHFAIAYVTVQPVIYPPCLPHLSSIGPGIWRLFKHTKAYPRGLL